MPVITLCVLMLSNMAIFFLSDPRHYQLNLSILYFYSGFYVVYFTVLFLDLAPGTNWPLLWAGMGRLCRSLCVGAFLLCPSGLFGLLGQEYSIVLNTLLLAGVCAIFFWSGQLRDRGSAGAAPPLRQDQAIGLFAQQHALTRRETDVLRAVLASSEPLGNIAACLGISERVMQRHLTSIYGKCRVSGRLELVTAFFGQTPRNLRPRRPGYRSPCRVARPQPCPPPCRQGCRPPAGDSPQNTRAPVTVLPVTGALVLTKGNHPPLGVIAQAGGTFPAPAEGATLPGPKAVRHMAGEPTSRP